jgi:Na+/proline symporter
MLFVLTLAGILCFANFGSPTELYANAASLRPQWSTNTSAAYLRLAFFGGFMTWVFVHSCLPHTIMRVFTAEDEKSGRLGLSFGSFLISAFALLALVYITGAAVIVNGGADLESYDYVFMTVIDSIFPTLRSTISLFLGEELNISLVNLPLASITLSKTASDSEFEPKVLRASNWSIRST